MGVYTLAGGLRQSPERGETRAPLSGLAVPRIVRQPAAPLHAIYMNQAAQDGPAIDQGAIKRKEPAMSRVMSLVYGVACYAVFFATFLYAAGFVAGFLTPTQLDGPASMGFGKALAINLGLLALFAVQHSVMARPAFKRWWTRIVPEHLERSTYTLLSSVALILLFAFWAPMGGVVWAVEQPAGKVALWGLAASGWLLVLVSTFLLNHFDLFGLRQVWLYFRGREYTPLKFGTPWLYRHVRHPLYVGWFTAFWATPTMTVAHLVFALMTSVYILIAIQFEERDLEAALPEYAAYKKRVPMLVPRGGGVARGSSLWRSRSRPDLRAHWLSGQAGRPHWNRSEMAPNPRPATLAL